MERAGDTALLQNIHRLDLLAFGWCHQRNAEAMIAMLEKTLRREGFGDTIADSARAVDTGKYPPAALEYRMAVKGLF